MSQFGPHSTKITIWGVEQGDTKIHPFLMCSADEMMSWSSYHHRIMNNGMTLPGPLAAASSSGGSGEGDHSFRWQSPPVIKAIVHFGCTSPNIFSNSPLP